MLLSQITTDPKRFQFRRAAYSEATVNGIMAEGFIPAKFGTIPIIADGEGVYVVAGDGHSRYEVIRRLAEKALLPDTWAVGDDWEIPTELVTPDQIASLKLANLGRNNLDPMEEAAAFKSLVDEGMSVEDIALRAHKDPTTIKKTILLTSLAACIQAMVGKAADAGGINKETAIILAEQFARYQIGVQQQQELYQHVLAHSNLTPNFVRSLIGKIGDAMTKRQGGADMLFAIPPSIQQTISKLQEESRETLKILTSLKALMKYADSGVLDRIPGIKAMLTEHGATSIQQLEYEANIDGTIVADLCLV